MPYRVPAFDGLPGLYGPVGKTDSEFRPYWEMRRRMSPSR